MIETAIIGTGVAGVSAALTLFQNKKEFLWFGTGKLSDKIRKAECIRNYPGLASVSGEEFAGLLKTQLGELEIEITEKTVSGIYETGGFFTILCGQEMFEARTVILATGVESTRPLKGEREFLGRGVSYCATCDGLLYRGRTIAILCASPELEHEAAYLCELAGRAYVLPLYQGAKLAGEKVELVTERALEIAGDDRVRRLILKERELEVDGVFLLKAAVSPAVLVHGLAMEEGQVVVNRSMEINLSGLFAAGDCTGRPYQYVKAAGEGNVAAHSVIRYLAAQRR